MARCVVLFASLLVFTSVVQRCVAEFSSKTPYGYYRASEFKLSNDQLFEFDYSKFAFPTDEVRNCEQLSLNVLFRHGTRNPSADNLERANAVVKQVQLHVNELKVTADGFDPRTLSVPQGGGRDLKTDVATAEFGYLAEYVTALLNNASCANVKLDARSSDVARTIESTKILIDQLCNASDTRPSIVLDDTLLRFFDSCERYVKEVDENATATAEVDRFTETTAFLDVLAGVNKTFADAGFRFTEWIGRQIDRDDLQTYYELCALDIAHNRSALQTTPGWCGLVRKHFTTIDYYMDMDYYYANAHAYPINYQAACGFFDTLLGRIRSGNSQANASLMVGHLETVVPVLTLLDLIDRSEQLTVANFPKLGTSRNFRIQRLSQFAGNLALTTMLCGAETRIYYMLNERLVRPNYCKASNYCTLQETAAYYATACPKPLSEICAVPPNAAAYNKLFVSPWLLIGLLSAFVIYHH